jgi:C-terminal processing protease CtpA/Prc
MEVPRGPVTLTFVNKEGVTSTRQVIWDYVKEEFNHQTKSQKNLQEQNAMSKFLNRIDMKSDLMTADSSTENPFMVGARKSFIPALGKMLWQSADDNSFHAYTYLNDEGKVIGFLRISSYSKTFKDSAAFKEIIKHFKETTDALIIDQVNNPGGSVFYLYSLVSMLNDTSVATPKHRMAITASDVKESMMLLNETKDIDSDEKAKAYVKPEDANGYYVDLNFIKFARDYAQFIIDQFHSGNRLTVPYHIWGVDMINPHPEVSYQKPILLLINELDFSGGDFFPAIMQDAKRVTILGTRTAGAGGYVQSYNIDNLVGLESFRLTGSLAERVDSNPIENLGVKPDVEYQLTQADYKGNFVPYVKKIKETLRGMLTK